jgi:FeS assembly protein IscX
MKWVDIYQIAESLEEKFPDIDIVNIKFTDLQKRVMSLQGFADEEKNCNEKVLEAIQAAWLDER